MLTQSALFIIGLFTQSVLYGLFLASFVHCLRWLLYADDGWRFKTNINWPMLTVTVLVFLFSTVDLALSFPIITITPNNERQIFEWSIFNCINDALEPATMLIVDAVLIYRCWKVYGRSWQIACLPLMLWIVCFITIVLELVYLIPMVDQPQGPQQRVSGSLYLACVTTFYVGNITLNVYATVAIIYRILRVPNRSRRLRKTCRIIIESGLLYTLPTLVYAITVTILLGKSDPITSLADAIKFSMTGIAFNLLLIRVYEERTAPHDSHADVGSQNQLNSLSTLRFYTVDAAIQETERSISEISAAQSGSGKEVVQRSVVGEKRGKEILPVVT